MDIIQRLERYTEVMPLASEAIEEIRRLRAELDKEKRNTEELHEELRLREER